VVNVPRNKVSNYSYMLNVYFNSNILKHIKKLQKEYRIGPPQLN